MSRISGYCGTINTCLVVVLCTWVVLLVYVRVEQQTNLLANNKSAAALQWHYSSATRTKSRSSTRNQSEFSAHYVRFYPTSTPGESHQLCYTECIALLSVLVFLKPDQVYIHTDVPGFWPFASCSEIVHDFSKIRLIYRQPPTTIGDFTVSTPHHRADITKLEILRQYGGVALDFDVFIIKGKRIRKIYDKYECILSQEGPNWMNAGFSACHPNAEWPKIMLDQYRQDYRQAWLYNSAQVPFAIYKSNESYYRQKNYIDNSIANNPSGTTKYQMWLRNNLIDWKAKLGYHSFFHYRNFGPANLTALNSGFGHLMKFVLRTAEAEYNKTKNI